MLQHVTACCRHSQRGVLGVTMYVGVGVLQHVVACCCLLQYVADVAGVMFLVYLCMCV